MTTTMSIVRVRKCPSAGLSIAEAWENIKIDISRGKGLRWNNIFFIHILVYLSWGRAVRTVADTRLSNRSARLDICYHQRHRMHTVYLACK